MHPNQNQNPQKTQQQQILNTILNNTTTTLTYNNRDYVILIKKQKNKDYCTLFLTDCSDCFWIQKIDIAYCEKLKQEMNVKTRIQIFARHFVEGFRNGPRIQGLEPSASLKLFIKISQGLIINCLINFDICIKADQNPQQYKQLIRNFFKQLYQAKQSQIQTLKQQLQKLKQQPSQKQPQTTQKDKNYIKNILSKPQKKQIPSISSKNRDLINPNKKKRKHQGLKLTGCD